MVTCMLYSCLLLLVCHSVPLCAYCISPNISPEFISFPDLGHPVSKWDWRLIRTENICPYRQPEFPESTYIAKLPTSNFFQLLGLLYSLETSKTPSSALEWAHDCTSMIGHAPYIHYICINVSRPCPQLVPGVYSRPDVYLLQSWVYPRHINKIGVYSKDAFIRGCKVSVIST